MLGMWFCFFHWHAYISFYTRTKKKLYNQHSYGHCQEIAEFYLTVVTNACWTHFHLLYVYISYRSSLVGPYREKMGRRKALMIPPSQTCLWVLGSRAPLACGEVLPVMLAYWVHFCFVAPWCRAEVERMLCCNLSKIAVYILRGNCPRMHYSNTGWSRTDLDCNKISLD